MSPQPEEADMTKIAGRGAEAYRQAYEYVAAGGLYRTAWATRRAAMRYLLLTASPPLTPDEQAVARRAMRHFRHAPVNSEVRHVDGVLRAVHPATDNLAPRAADKEKTAMPPTPLHLMYQLYETAWKVFIAIPLTLARPVLDLASRGEASDA